jgi:putative membrane protein
MTQEEISMKSALTIGLTFTAGIVLSGCVLTQKMMPGTMSNSEIFGVLDTINHSEIDAGNLAREKATAPEVRLFASRMVSEHQRMMEDMNELVQRMDVQPQKPALAFTLNDTHQGMMEELRDKSGSDFDKAYIEYQVKMHEQAVDLVKNAADEVDNFSLKKHLREARPELYSHLDSAQSIQGE